MSFIEIHERWKRFQEMDQLQAGISAFTLTIFGVIGCVVTLVKGYGWKYTVNDLPIILRPLAYFLFLAVLWSGFQFFDRLLPHAFRLKSSFWIKAGWIVLLLIAWPFGPALYYLLVYRKNPLQREGGS